MNLTPLILHIGSCDRAIPAALGQLPGVHQLRLHPAGPQLWLEAEVHPPALPTTERDGGACDPDPEGAVRTPPLFRKPSTLSARDRRLDFWKVRERPVGQRLRIQSLQCPSGAGQQISVVSGPARAAGWVWSLVIDCNTRRLWWICFQNTLAIGCCQSGCAGSDIFIGSKGITSEASFLEDFAGGKFLYRCSAI